MADCSQHKHMPSWLTHFLLRSTSPVCWATQAQDTTATGCKTGPVWRASVAQEEMIIWGSFQPQRGSGYPLRTISGPDGHSAPLDERP
ncbi:hypothetical protein EYF80_031508 [Liparis tanakae]|uniref:Secreted protein n=1 Tax=Liparis tanakae TaxID=230148 RepID=A0A4Z2GXF3_9TELE|nr:hypothetical protein EYF80_031508 [Liparis tanakae]